MPEFENDSDRLEQFFRKATNKPEVAFSEDDWSKLEARLDAADAARALKVKSSKKTITTAAVVGVLLLSSVGIWWGSEIGQSTRKENQTNVPSAVDAQSQGEAQGQDETSDVRDQNNRLSVPKPGTSAAERSTSPLASDATSSHPNTSPSAITETQTTIAKNFFKDNKNVIAQPEALVGRGENGDVTPSDEDAVAQNIRLSDEGEPVGNQELVMMSKATTEGTSLAPLADGKVRNELVLSTSDITERNKQRARIELPGAEEADQTGRQTMVEEEHASEKEHVAKPRLSLLLSFAPDFSGTSINQYSPPGKAFGGMIRYHLNRWSISAGVIKNYKQYTGAGEYYTPPTGYWKYYTNGVIPETIDGECSILEFPIMMQYTIRERGKNRCVVGAGASSYLMQSESYRYNFAQPNPGAKEGWDSRGSSRFMFNMLNFTIGYEHQVLPGLMIGLEPYVKLPLEEIGWSNLKLYSSGASITLRYTLIGNKKITPVASRSRGPD